MGKTESARQTKSAKQLKVSAASKTIKKADKKIEKPKKQTKWNHSKVTDGDYFSCHQYMRVEKIKGTDISLKNERGELVEIDLDCLNEDSYSADHFEKEVTCNMTELSEILQDCKDTIFKVVFKKKIDEHQVFDKLAKIKAKDLKSPQTSTQLAKQLLEGDMCEIVGHLVKSEQHMGRSLVIDLNAPASQNFRQVDHRTIQSIIFKNVKYNLGKKSTLSSLEGWKYSDKAKWNIDKLKVGDWFSENQYYQL